MHELTTVSSGTLQYDPKGNLTVDPTKSGTSTYMWDFDNRLKTAVTAAGTCNFTYDAFGRRVEKNFIDPPGTSVVGHGRMATGEQRRVVRRLVVHSRARRTFT